MRKDGKVIIPSKIKQLGKNVKVGKIKVLGI